ncbi:cupin domain-containing protein [Heliobacillus mobilis]|uniref:Cupin domain-containing protein n=1 Tax=Heliobacterium mobile TaxID=28064 RepID=A0A6I3SMJ3_HELMO|nr:cupin domain-containing protein [Heliobacterium mobile]MTV50211.1 cupin domain-containing protein [Heliobacterium mobile]
MYLDDFSGKILEGKLFCNEKIALNEEIPWNRHPSFSGVYLKDLVKAKDTNNKFSVHMVRVEAGAEIGNHIHVGKFEMHQVISGDGICSINDSEINYTAGVMSVIPENQPHRVLTDKQELLMIATFVPALT